MGYNLFERLPFSERTDSDVVTQASYDLATTLSLPGPVSPLVCDAATALRVESNFRRSWWAGCSDLFRDAIHQFKWRMHQAGNDDPKAFANAWSSMVSHVQSCMWRDHVRSLCAAKTPSEVEYIRRAVGAAQQLWSRAVRWDTAMPYQANPFLPFVELVSHGAWPVGFRNGAIQVLQTRSGQVERCAGTGWEASLNSFQGCRSSEPYVFLIGPFRDRFTTSVLTALRTHDINVVHNQVDETRPPEQQLGRMIKSAAACVAAFERYDDDFGLPWWVFQEIDFATACGVPVAVFTGDHRDEHKHGAQHFSGYEAGVVEEFWTWLETTQNRGLQTRCCL